MRGTKGLEKNHSSPAKVRDKDTDQVSLLILKVFNWCTMTLGIDF